MQHIRKSKASKIIASYLALQLIVTTIQPTNLFALTGGPSQPEFNSFTPIGTSDMVNLSSGDFNYNIPIMDVGGYPLNLAYDSGITMDQEASWVGLGWNLNVGHVSRQLRGLPDDFNGAEITYENNVRDNFTVGVNSSIQVPLFGFDLAETANVNVGLGLQYNNYNGFTFSHNIGPSFDISEQLSAGINISSNSSGDVTVTPNISLKSKDEWFKNRGRLTTNIGVPFNTNQGLMGVNMSNSASGKYDKYNKNLNDGKGGFEKANYHGGKSAFLSFNDNLSYQPNSQLSFKNESLTLEFGLGTELWGAETPQISLTGYGALQHLRDEDKYRRVKAYGYDFSENAPTTDVVLDFNRENEGTVTTNTTMLPIVNQTYDLYAINGQGIGGMFRPHRSQVGHVYDETIISNGAGGTAEGEFGPGAGAHFGAGVKVNPSFTKSGRWELPTNKVLNKFKIKKEDPNQDIKYEQVYYKMVGELTADEDDSYVSSIISEPNPVKFDIEGGKFARQTANTYKVKQYTYNDGSEDAISYSLQSVEPIKRTKRQLRTRAIQMLKENYETIELKEGRESDTITEAHSSNRYVGTKILNPDGSTYVYGEPAFNTKKVEATFAMPSSNDGNCTTGLVSYSGNDATNNNSNGRDHYFNRIETPAYAHSFLLTSVLSADYEDLTNDGPTSDDLGSYTKFVYKKNSNKEGNYKWRVPYETGKASYQEGLKADHKDDKGNYVYGEKEVKYIDVIETKTHIAKFISLPRKDGIGVLGENGGESISDAGKLHKLDKIELFSKKDLDTPIKTAHFEYEYSLCPGVPNNSGEVEYNVDGVNVNYGGKLTLKKVYFTYGKSNMGKYTPYEFHYDNDNPEYDLKAYDIWGNYKPNEGGCGHYDDTTTSEFPFVQQEDEDKDKQNARASAWSLSSITLPSGGELKVEYETDDYGYVQDKHAMQMFKVAGAGDSASSLEGNKLFQGSDDKDYIYVKIENGTTLLQFKEKYLKDIGQSDSNPMYFSFLLNMTSSDYDRVSGYAQIVKSECKVFDENGNTYGAIKLKRLKREGGIINSNEKVNPIALAGWYFGRTHLNRQIYGIEAPEDDAPGNLIALAQAFESSITAIADIFDGPNKALRDKNCAQRFSPSKSWIRLYHPDDTKLGGGARVKTIKMYDNWDEMTANPEIEPFGAYGNYYGQEYQYTNADGSSSGVATFEPNASKENPLIRPIYHEHQNLVAPKAFNYTEKPIGQSLYPSPTVTYSRVVVSNLGKVNPNDGTLTLKKHATGRVINEFFTSKDFPTVSDFTDITSRVDKSLLGEVLKVRNRNSLTYSQGFVVRTNDMNGKTKSQTVQTEGQEGNEYISRVEYKYSLKEDKKTLDNDLKIIQRDGNVDDAPIGVTYDMVTDFRSYYNSSEVLGADGNLAALLVLLGVLPVPTILPVVQSHEQELKTATITKVIHSSGILKEKIAYDLGSKISTENHAWDAYTGNVLLTKTDNEYRDDVEGNDAEHYYNLSYPAHWYYGNMGAASTNIDTEGFLHPSGSQLGVYSIRHPYNSDSQTTTFVDPQNVFTLGDELYVYKFIFDFNLISPIFPFAYVVQRVWVADFPGNSVYLIDETGQPAEDLMTNSWGISFGSSKFRVHRSGYRNLLTANMASVTLQKSPIENGQISTSDNWQDFNVINASAVEYSDTWNAQCEFRLPDPNTIDFNEDGTVASYSNIGFNPYLYNVKGDWRAVKSYAYLTSRNNGSVGFNPRKEGFFNNFEPFYNSTASGSWTINKDNWTYASEVTQYSPYGAELENKDALNRYSAAQYGYAYTLPTAVGSNAQYQEIAFDGFEDYGYYDTEDDTSELNPHFGFQDELQDNANVQIDNSTSHSGKNSIKLAPGATAKIEHRLLDCEDEGSTKFDAIDDSYDAPVCMGREFDLPVLDNDIFTGSDLMNFYHVITDPPSPNYGYITYNDNGTTGYLNDDYLVYTTDISSPGVVDSFTYQICDSAGNCDIATVTITSKSCE